jgi:mRNA-degrading endonuclease RelE of RelBE toxin-antitoxin system
MYRIELQNRARRQLDKIARGRDFDRICAVILELGYNPRSHGVKKLTGNIYRARVGYWRVIFKISDNDRTVIVGKIARRAEDTYNRAKDLF